MKLIRFSFKSEPIWMLVFAVVPGLLGLLVVLIVLLVRWLSS